MRITRFSAAPTYSPPLHAGVECKRLQGHEAGPTKQFWVGHSVYKPGGAASASATLEETIYTVLDGEVVVSADGREETLRALDSVHLLKGTLRSVENRSDRDASILVTIALPRSEVP
jgi:uncharacterized cupin superfamily protein